MKQVRYAVVGAGWIAREAFLPALAKTGNSSVTAIVSASPERALPLAAAYGVECVIPYDGYDALMAGDSIDAVYIALPNALHADYAVRALRAGKHVMVEKPMAATEAECSAVIAAAQDGAAYLLTAYRLHNEPGTLDVIARVRAGEIGDPRVYSATFTAHINDDNHRLSAGHWGGPLQDVGVYCVNMARHIFDDEPVTVSAIASHGDNDPRFAEVPESVTASLLFPRGRLAQFTVSFNASEVDSFLVAGTKGSLHVDPGFRFETPHAAELRRDGVVTREAYPVVDHFAGMIRYFSDCILTVTPPHLGPEEGLADVRILIAIENAAKTGQTQTLDPFSRSGALAPEMARRIG